MPVVVSDMFSRIKVSLIATEPSAEYRLASSSLCKVKSNRFRVRIMREARSVPRKFIRGDVISNMIIKIKLTLDILVVEVSTFGSQNSMAVPHESLTEPRAVLPVPSHLL
jgi:hypothetical protein